MLPVAGSVHQVLHGWMLDGVIEKSLRPVDEAGKYESDSRYSPLVSFRSIAPAPTGCLSVSPSLVRPD